MESRYFIHADWKALFIKTVKGMRQVEMKADIRV